MVFAVGRVTELHRWPVKSMAGEPVDALRVDARGAAGDRTHALYDVHQGAPRRLTARQAPRLLAWRAGYPGVPGEVADPEDPPVATVTAPDGTAYRWDDPALGPALEADLGRPVELRRDVIGQQDLGYSLLLTTQATLDALGEELGGPVDLRRFRTNVHAVLDVPAWTEHEWEGRTLLIGDQPFDFLHACVRCVIPTRDPDTQEKWGVLLRHLAREHHTLFGMNVRPRPDTHATIRVGDPIRVE